MNPTMMLTIATILLGITAAGGLVMAIIRFSGADRPPSWIAIVHGLLAGSGLTLLLYAALTSEVPATIWAGIAFLVAAALAGTYLNLAYHAKLLPIPKATVVIHALIAVAGFVLILLSLFQG